ncbi:MAG: class I SAM-dependent methyltransferase [Acidobacteriota bacterium]
MRRRERLLALLGLLVLPLAAAGGPLAGPSLGGVVPAVSRGTSAEEPGGRGPHDATSRHPFDEVDKWVEIFDDPARDAWQRPAVVTAALDLEPGMTVADIGAGTGYFLPYLSKAVSPGGLVLAIDIEPEMVRHIGDRAGEEGLENVVPVLAAPDDPFLPRGRVDRVLIVNTYHHFDGRLDYFRRMRASLAPGGRVAIVDFRKKPLPVGPPLEHKLAKDFVIEEMRTAGWRLEADKGILPHQYFLVFVPERKGAA